MTTITTTPIASLDGDDTSRLIAENGRKIAALIENSRTRTDLAADLIAEDKVSANIHSILAQHLPIPFRSREILKSAFGHIDEQFSDALYDAADAGLIDNAALASAFATDIIIGCGRRGERENIYLVGEISRTINNDDITRAYERARTIGVATGADTMAAAIGGFVAPPQTRLADELGVRVFIVAQLQE